MERDESQEVCKAFRANFNSHAHVERDLALADFVTGWINFNSHAHVERDNVNKRFSFGGEDFNSHAHVERDWLRVAHAESA